MLQTQNYIFASLLFSKLSAYLDPSRFLVNCYLDVTKLRNMVIHARLIKLDLLDDILLGAKLFSCLFLAIVVEFKYLCFLFTLYFFFVQFLLCSIVFICLISVELLRGVYWLVHLYQQ